MLYNNPDNYKNYKLLMPKFYDFIFCRCSWSIEYNDSFIKVINFIGKDNCKVLNIPWCNNSGVDKNYYIELFKKLKFADGYKISYYDDKFFSKYNYLMKYNTIITKNLENNKFLL